MSARINPSHSLASNRPWPAWPPRSASCSPCQYERRSAPRLRVRPNKQWRQGSFATHARTHVGNVEKRQQQRLEDSADPRAGTRCHWLPDCHKNIKIKAGRQMVCARAQLRHVERRNFGGREQLAAVLERASQGHRARLPMASARTHTVHTSSSLAAIAGLVSFSRAKPGVSMLGGYATLTPMPVREAHGRRDA